MSQPDDTSSAMDFPALAEVLCAIAIRSGDLLELDGIAELPPAERAVRVMMVISRAAQADPWIAKTLVNLDAVSLMRTEYLQRKGQT